MNVAVCARVSSERQDMDLSISAQLRALQEYATKNGHVVVREYVDEAESARTMDRPSFQEMLTAARGKDKPFEAILLWSYSRFARNLEDAALLKGMLKRRGIKLISITEPFNDSPHGEAMGAILDVFNHLTSAVLAQDVVRGMRESASRGFYPGGTVPFGYRREGYRMGGRNARSWFQTLPQRRRSSESSKSAWEARDFGRSPILSTRKESRHPAALCGTPGRYTGCSPTRPTQER